MVKYWIGAFIYMCAPNTCAGSLKVEQIESIEKTWYEITW